MRKNDTLARRYKRSTRYQLVNDQWYFKSREGDLLGPYDSPIEAAKAVDSYIELLQADERAPTPCFVRGRHVLRESRLTER